MHYIGIPGCGSSPRLRPGGLIIAAWSLSWGGRLLPSPPSLLWADGATPSTHLPRESAWSPWAPARGDQVQRESQQGRPKDAGDPVLS